MNRYGPTRVCRARVTVLVLVLCVSVPAGAVVLDCGETSAFAGQSGVNIPIMLTPAAGEEVCGVQLDLLYDGDWLAVDDVSAGSAAISAGKDVNFSIIEDGHTRIIVSGFNQYVMGGGVVAYVEFSIAMDTPAGVYAVTPTNVLATDPWGVDVPATGISGAITVGTINLEGTDVNGDGSRNAVDVQLVVNAALGLAGPYDCDVDGDGHVNALDIQAMINAVLFSR